MMKKSKLIYTLGLAVLCGLFSSCYEDLSTDASVKIGEVVIDTTGFGFTNSLIEFPQGNILSLNPVVTQTGVQSPDLSYEWRLALTSNWSNKEYAVVGTEKNLSAFINKNPSSEPYFLWYVVTDKSTGLQYSKTWKLMVTSSAGDGLLVADTQDGTTSDITLVRANCLSSNYNGGIFYKRDGYSGMNGSKMNGLITQLLYSKLYIGTSASYWVYAMTDKTLVRLDPETYGISKSYNEIFFVAPDAPAPKTIQNGSQDMFYVDGTDLYSLYISGSSTSYQIGSSLNYVKPGSTVLKNVPNKYFLSFASENNASPVATFYDETQGKFDALFGLSNTLSIGSVIANTEAVNAYNPVSIPNMEAIGSGPATNNRHLHVLKNKSTAEVAFYTMVAGYDDVNGANVQSVSKYTTASCPNIASALGFETCENRDVVYYATPSAVYGAFISGTGVSGSVRFTPPSGETVTCIKLFREAWYLLNTTDETKTAMAENCNQLLVATYNSSTKEGKVYALPITNISGALGTPTADKTFSGFGRITAMATQGK